MLSSLQIENVAVIQKADVHFEKGLNVLTGETGAGKSILIDSINAILGSRTSRELVRAGAAKAVIRAAFEQVPDAVQDNLEKAGYERSAELLLTREITAEGKSTCRINGMPATAAVLRELCGGLININGQHDSVGLLNPAHHEGILDDYAQNREAYQNYYKIYKELIRVKRELDSLVTDEEEKRRKTDLLQYQVGEIDDAALTAGEEETLESRRKVLANASTIREQIARAYAALSGGDEAAGGVDLVGEASNAIDMAAQLDSGLADSAGQLLDLYYTLKDLSGELASRLEDYESNDGELDEIEQRLDLIYKLKRKYGDTVEDVLAFGEKAREELERIQFSQEHHDRLQAEKRRLDGTPGFLEPAGGPAQPAAQPRAAGQPRAGQPGILHRHQPRRAPQTPGQDRFGGRAEPHHAGHQKRPGRPGRGAHRHLRRDRQRRIGQGGGQDRPGAAPKRPQRPPDPLHHPHRPDRRPGGLPPADPEAGGRGQGLYPGNAPRRRGPCRSPGPPDLGRPGHRPCPRQRPRNAGAGRARMNRRVRR